MSQTDYKLSASQMLYETKILYESIASSAAPGYTNREWSVILTQAQEELINEMYLDGIEKDDFNKRVMQSLVTNTTRTAFTASDIFEYSYTVLLPSDILFVKVTPVIL